MTTRDRLRERILSAFGRVSVRIASLDDCAPFRGPRTTKVRESVYLPSGAHNAGTPAATRHGEPQTAAGSTTNVPGPQPVGRADAASETDHNHVTPATQRIVHHGGTVGTVTPDLTHWASPSSRQSVVVTWPSVK